MTKFTYQKKGKTFFLFKNGRPVGSFPGYAELMFEANRNGFSSPEVTKIIRQRKKAARP